MQAIIAIVTAGLHIGSTITTTTYYSCYSIVKLST